MYKRLQLFSWLLLLYLIGIINNDVSAQNTFYYNKYKHWSPELESLATNGDDVMAITSLGSCYDRADGVERDTQKAFKLFQRAADLGDFLGLYNLGWYYFAGIATEKNYLLSEKYLLEAIKKNPKLTPAYEGLSEIYDKGGLVWNQIIRKHLRCTPKRTILVVECLYLIWGRTMSKDW